MQYTYPTPAETSYLTPEQSKATLGSGLQNALIMAGLSMLGAPRTPYRQTFTENLARGLGSGFGAFNQTVAGAQQQAETDYWKKRQLAMQEQLNKSHSALYDLTAKEKQAEIDKANALTSGMADILKKRDAFIDVSGNVYTQPEANNILKMIAEERTPIGQGASDAISHMKDFSSTLTPYDTNKAIIDLLMKYEPKTAMSYILEKPKTPTTIESAVIEAITQGKDITSLVEAKKKLEKPGEYKHLTREQMLADFEDKERIKSKYDKGADRDVRRDKRDADKLERDRVSAYNNELRQIKKEREIAFRSADKEKDTTTRHRIKNQAIEDEQSKYADLSVKYPDLYDGGKGAKTANSGGNKSKEQLIKDANDAIARGADPVKVKERLKQMGISVK